MERKKPLPLILTGSAGRYYRWLVITAGVGLLVWVVLFTRPRPVYPWIGLVIALFVAFQVYFPLRLLHYPTSLNHVVTLGGGLLYGAPTALLAAALGISLGYAARARRLSRHGASPAGWFQAAFEIGQQSLSLVLALLVTGRLAGLYTAPAGVTSPASSAGTTGAASWHTWPALLLPLLLFAGLYAALFLIDYLSNRPETEARLNAELALLGLVISLPLPFILFAVLAYPAIGAGSLILLGGVPAALAVPLNGISRARRDLERRLQELSTLNQVSQALRSTLDLERLLSVMHVQVSQFLGVDNFYVALYDADTQQIWYPLAVKYGSRQHWPRRSLEDRLTDRVIRQGKPILLSPRPDSDVQYRDLPPSEVTPTAWLGVPLISPSKTIGCLALFSVTPQAEFTPADMQLLTILSGQASVAIENALFYAQAQRRAAQLETLNQTSAMINASLDPQEVLDQVCRSAALIAGATRSAIFLLAPDESQVWLAHAYRLSERFQERNRSFSLTHDGRARCLRLRRPVLVSEVSTSGLEDDLLEDLQQEGIQAFGHFPLSTPEGEIGILAVYFDLPHPFRPDEQEWAQVFAGQAAVAVSNARLHARTDLALAQRVQQLAILEAVGRELSAAAHSEQLFEIILNYAREFTNSPWGCLGLYDPDTQLVQIQASYGYRQAAGAFPAGEGIIGRTVRSQQAVVVGDVRQEADTIDLTGGQARSQISVPLVHEGQVLGVMTLESPQIDGYTNSDRAFISQLANQATVAIVNAGLYADLAHGRDRLAAILDSVQEGILMIGAGGTVLLANQAIQAMTGMAPSEIMGLPFTALPAQALQALGYSVEEAVRLVAAPGRGQVTPDPGGVIKTGATSPERILERTSLPVLDSGGHSIGWLIVLHDVTEEHRIAEARELITETLMHDLRSPLSAVLGALDMIEEEVQRPEADSQITHEALQIARRSGQRLLAMVESLLDISRMESGKMELSLETVDLGALSAGLLAELSPQANESGLVLSSEIPAELPQICADRSKLARVLANLLDNALKFTPGKGQVVLSAELRPDEMVAITVADTGPGIPVEYREKIFERFTQVPGLRGRRRGSGLGLTFCRLAVEAHGGRIWVEPRAGGGSLFTFTLPTYRPTNRPDNPSSEQDSA